MVFQSKPKQRKKTVGGRLWIQAFAKKYENPPTTYQRETNSVGTPERCEDKRCSKVTGVEEINGDESDVPRLPFYSCIQMES